MAADTAPRSSGGKGGKSKPAGETKQLQTRSAKAGLQVSESRVERVHLFGRGADVEAGMLRSLWRSCVPNVSELHTASDHSLLNANHGEASYLVTS